MPTTTGLPSGEAVGSLMAGYATDTWRRVLTVYHGAHTVRIVESGDGVNPPILTATVDGEPAAIFEEHEVLIDGITPQEEVEA